MGGWHEPVTPARCCRGLLAYRRQELAAGRLSGAELTLQPVYELVCRWFADHEYSAERFRAILEERVLEAKDNRVAVACSGILGAWQDSPRRRVLAAFAEGPWRAIGSAATSSDAGRELRATARLS